MAIREGLLPEYDMEMAATRAVLERVPDAKLDWQPHEKSMTLGRLAAHLAEIPQWAEVMIGQDEFDLAPPGGSDHTPRTLGSTSEILEQFDASAAKAREMIAATSDEDFLKPWTLKKGGEALFSAPRIGVVRRQMLHHIIHHRGQLTVFLRLNDVPVPQTYGPTADEPDF